MIGYNEEQFSELETAPPDEVLIPDSRSNVTRAAESERRLVSALNGSPIPFSHLHEAHRLPRPH